jgi:adenylate cyclase
MDRTIIGDAVNIAQRLMTRADPNTIMISEATYQAMNANKQNAVRAGELTLKGKSKTVNAYLINLD